MKRHLFGLFLVLTLVCSVAGQKAQAVKTDVIDANLRKHVGYLASDKLEGRRTGEPGATVAAGYVTNQFAASTVRWARPIHCPSAIRLPSPTTPAP